MCACTSGRLMRAARQPGLEEALHVLLRYEARGPLPLLRILLEENRCGEEKTKREQKGANSPASAIWR